ncbi:MAG: dockerin type I repeat-containing protein, partial [Isosphaeraceae bacterium]
PVTGVITVADKSRVNQSSPLTITVVAADASGATATATLTFAVVASVTRIEITGADPRDTPVGTASPDSPVLVTFSDPVLPGSFDASALSLTNDGRPIPLGSVTLAVTRVGDANQYKITGLGLVTAAPGTYVLTVDASRVLDAAGAAGTGTASVTWTTVAVAGAPTGLSVTPDSGSFPNDGVTKTGVFTFSGTFSGPGQTLEIFDVTTNTDLGIATLTGTSFSLGVNLAEGIHVLRARAVGPNGPLDAFHTVLVDLTAPISRVEPLPFRQPNATFTIPVTFGDPAGTSGASASGVARVELHVSANGGESWSLFKTLDAGGATSGTLNFTFTGRERNNYAFRSVAYDVAGNVKTAPESPSIEASTSLPNLSPPITHAIASNPSYSWDPFHGSLFAAIPASSYDGGTGNFTIHWGGATPNRDVGTPNGSLTSVSVYVRVDNGPAQLVGRSAVGSPNAKGIYSGSVTFAAIADGAAHTYAFHTLGTDDLGLTQVATGAADVVFTDVAHAASLTASLAVQKNIAGRSHVRYLDVNFNQPLSNASLAALQAGLSGSSPGNHLQLVWYGTNLTPSSLPIGSVALFGNEVAVTLHSPSANAPGTLSIDFSPAGITRFLTGGGVSETGAGKVSGDGWYALGVNPTGNQSDQVFWLPFFRLLGDVDGSGTVTGPMNAPGSDAHIVNQARGSSGPLLNADVDGNGSVNGSDLVLTIKANGRTVGATPPQNFPLFQLFSGMPGPGTPTGLTRAELDALVPMAIAAWQGAGLDDAGVSLLSQLRFEVADLGSNILALQGRGVVQVNQTAAGHRWATSGGTPGPDEVDLLTVLANELGHAIGSPDGDQPGELMDLDLGLGVRRMPTASAVAAAVPPPGGVIQASPTATKSRWRTVQDDGPRGPGHDLRAALLSRDPSPAPRDRLTESDHPTPTAGVTSYRRHSGEKPAAAFNIPIIAFNSATNSHPAQRQDDLLGRALDLLLDESASHQTLTGDRRKGRRPK